jgi:hypothetical protein
VAAGNEMRVGDAEREAAAAELQEHFASGRLNQDELNERLTAVFAAKTRGDLNALFSDLPSSGHAWAGADTAGGQTSGPGGPFSAGGPFGADGPFGPGGPFGGGRPFGPGGAWTHPGTADSYDDGQARGNAWRASAGRNVGRLVFSTVMLSVLFLVGILGVFGIGTGRPFGIVLILAAFALLRRLLFIVFGRRRARRGGGPRRRRR